MKKLKFLSPLIILFTVIILMTLGFWQIYRLNQKNLLVEKINYNLNLAAEDFPANFEISKNLYKKYKIDGNFLAGKNLLLYSSNSIHPEKHGYFILTPFKTNLGKIILVNRGWAPQSKASKLSSIDVSQVTIEAMTSIPAPKGLFSLENDIERNVWLYMDLKAMENYIQTPIEQTFYLVLTKSNPLNQDLYLKSPKDFVKVRNDHLWYVITWFSFAITVCIIFYIKVKKSKC